MYKIIFLTIYILYIFPIMSLNKILHFLIVIYYRYKNIDQ